MLGGGLGGWEGGRGGWRTGVGVEEHGGGGGGFVSVFVGMWWAGGRREVVMVVGLVGCGLRLGWLGWRSLGRYREERRFGRWSETSTT